MAGDNFTTPIKPIIYDPGKNEWILKENDIPGLKGEGSFFFIAPVHEEELLRNGQKYYRRTIHYRSPNRFGNEVEEYAIPMTASRLPGPTNGALDLDPKDRWILTGSPFLQFRLKNPPLDLEARLRKIMIRAGIKLGPNFGQELVDLLVDTAVMGVILTLAVVWIAAHCASGPAVVIPLIIDALGALALGFTLGIYTWSFLRSLWNFVEALVDAQSDEEFDVGAEGLAEMIRILAKVAVMFVVGRALKALSEVIVARIRPKAGSAEGPKPTKQQPVRLTRVTEELIRAVMKGAPLKTQQSGGVSIPKLQRMLNRWLLGETPPPIKVDNGIIVDGNHRYVVSRLLGKEVPIQPWSGGNPSRVVEWKDIKIDPIDWGGD